MADLVVVIPSRGRAGQAAALVDACRQTCTASTTLLVVVDADDPTADAYAAALTGRWPGRVELISCLPGVGHVGAINAGAGHVLADRPFSLYASARALAKLDDDHMPLTYGWDTAYLDALRDLGTGIVYGNDLLQGPNLPTAPAMTTDIVRALGYMAPPQLQHLYCDNFWLELGRQAGCLSYLPDVVVEHRHPVAGKAQWDAGYAAANSRERYNADGAAWRQYSVLLLPDAVAAVRALRGDA